MIIRVDGLQTRMPVASALCGRHIDSVELSANDLRELSNLDPERLHDLISNWAIRCGPPEEQVQTRGIL